jgi:hypothetical protein
MQNTYIHNLLQDTEISYKDFLVFPTQFLAFGKNMHSKWWGLDGVRLPILDGDVGEHDHPVHWTARRKDGGVLSSDTNNASPRECAIGRKPFPAKSKIIPVSQKIGWNWAAVISKAINGEKSDLMMSWWPSILRITRITQCCRVWIQQDWSNWHDNKQNKSVN